MHVLHLPPGHLWKMGLMALALTLVLFAVAAAVAPTLVDLSTPSTTPVETTASDTPSPPAWVKDPMAPPLLLQGR